MRFGWREEERQCVDHKGEHRTQERIRSFFIMQSTDGAILFFSLLL